MSGREDWLAIEGRGWGRFLARALVLGAVVFGAVRLAVARDGVPGGAARSFVTVAGTLTGVSAPTVAMTFTFHRPGGAMLCAPRVESVAVGQGGAFSAQVPLDAEPTRCPATLFDGSDVQVDVAVGTEVVARNAAINPVPYAHYASQYGTPDCPVGYERDSSNTEFTVCRKVVQQEPVRLVDEVVRVGAGATAFWVDRFEVSVFRVDPLPRGAVQLGAEDDNFGTAFSDGGQWIIPAFAWSIRGRVPTRFITWFQAQEACRLTGKRLPTSEEWLAAAQATPDPAGEPQAGECRTNLGFLGLRPQETGLASRCNSRWGASDMIGNVWEWVADWYAAPVESEAISLVAFMPDGGVSVSRVGERPAQDVWPTEANYHNDGTWNVGGGVDRPGRTSGLPAAGLHGGSFQSGPRAGRFSFNVGGSPTISQLDVGFRCVIPR